MNIFKRYHFYQISSTNDYARELLKTETYVAVTADYQWKGRGRNNKSWTGDYGNNVYCSVGIAHEAEKTMQELVSYQAIGCMAAQNLLASVAPAIDFRIKYPNDVHCLLGGQPSRKICGVLVEHEFLGKTCRGSIIGIGINVAQELFPLTLQEKAVSLRQLGYETRPENLVDDLLQHIVELLQKGAGQLMEAWKHRLNIIGKHVEITGEPGEWLIEKMLPDGRLAAQSLDKASTRIIDNGDSLRYALGVEENPC